MNKTFLDKEGLQVVADNTNLRVKIVTEVPSTPRNDMVIMYDGTDTADFSKGGIYKYTGTEWEPLGGSVEQTYDATSEKAQSGKAVDMAVRKFITNNTSLVWEDKTWSWNEFQGNEVWVYNDVAYFSEGSYHKVYDKSTDTWEDKTWYGLPTMNGGFYPIRDLWEDGGKVYLSKNAWDGKLQKVLNEATSTWEDKTWYGLTEFSAEYLWKDGDNVYYSKGLDQYVLNKATDTWEPKTWNGISSNFNSNGHCIWTDGTDIYYSFNSGDNENYILNRATDTWEPITWNISMFDGTSIWTDGNSTYCSDYYNGELEYVLNKEAGIWEPVSFGDKVIDGRDIWYYDGNLYCSVQTGQSDWVQYVAHRKFNTLIK